MRPTPNRIVEASTAVLALAFVGAGLWAMIAPRSFFSTAATFAPYNEHLIHDIGAFAIGLGSCLGAGLLVRDALLAVLAGNTIGATAHFVAHVIDRADGGRASDPATFGALALVLVLLMIARWRTSPARGTPARAGT